MSEKYGYGIETDALDELDRLGYMSAFVADAIGSIADSIDNGGYVTNKTWQGLYYIANYISDRIAAVHGRCARLEE